MTILLNAVQVEQFHDSFVLKYRGARTIPNESFQRVSGVVGSSYQWPIQGDADMILRGGFQTQIPASVIEYIPVLTTFENFALNLPVDQFEQALVNVNERNSLAKIHAKAAGRREDQTLIDAMTATAIVTAIPSEGVPTTLIPDGGTNLTVAKIIDASFILNQGNVPADERYLAMTPDQNRSLLKETEVTSADFNNTRVLVNGMVDTFMGFKIINIGGRKTGGFPLNGTIRTVYAWHADALGMAWSINAHLREAERIEQTSWLTVSSMRLGASGLLPAGIVHIECEEA